MSDIAREFIEQTIASIEKKNTPKLIRCLQEVTEEQIWMRPNPSSNSIGNLVIHLCGNMRQYIISGLGGRPDIRDRELEFSTRDGYSKKQLLDLLLGTLSETYEVLRGLDDERLLKTYAVQGSHYSGINIIIQVTEHYSHHTGQVIFWVKQVKGQDLGFYSHVNLNLKNGQ